MNKNNLFVFVTGAAIGSLVTWLFVKEKYERMLQEEVEALDEYYATRDEYDTEERDTEDQHDQTMNSYHVKPDIMEYAKSVQDKGYVNYAKNTLPENKSQEIDSVERPYVISPDEFGEVGYDQVSLTFYKDGVLTDEDGDIIEDVDDIVGRDSLETFGEYEDDSVFVRDDRRKTDYEILADPRNYTDVFNSDPHLAEGE